MSTLPIIHWESGLQRPLQGPVSTGALQVSTVCPVIWKKIFPVAPNCSQRLSVCFPVINLQGNEVLCYTSAAQVYPSDFYGCVSSKSPTMGRTLHQFQTPAELETYHKPPTANTGLWWASRWYSWGGLVSFKGVQLEGTHDLGEWRDREREVEKERGEGET